MSQDAKEKESPELHALLKREWSRSQLLKASGVGVLMAAVPGAAAAQVAGTGSTATTGTGPAVSATGSFSFPFYPQVTGTYTPETIPTILNIAQTMEYLATTLVNAAVTNATTMGITGLPLQALQAALAEEVYHVQFLSAMGAVPMTTTFTVPDPAALTSATVFFRTLELLETICNAAYLTANREFAELGQPLLAKFAYQAGSVEAEHRVAARTALATLNAGPAITAAPSASTAATTPWTGAAGVADPPVAPPIPPNNKAFETDYFLYLSDAVALLTTLGFLAGTGTQVTFPGTSTALTNAGTVGAAVLQRMPNNATTSTTASAVVSALSAIGVTTGVVARGGSGTGTS